MEVSGEQRFATVFLEGRWYRLAVRSVRQGILSYHGWTGSVRDHIRERLVLEDVESEWMEEMIALPDDRRHRVMSVRMPWVIVDRPEEATEDDLAELETIYNKITSDESDT